MATYSSNLKIELIGTGEQVGTWGTTTNSNFSNVFEQSIVGRVTVNFATDANRTLSASDSVASQDFRNVYLNLTSSGSLSTTRDLIVPTINKNYVIQNNTTGGQSIRVITAAGTGITVPNGTTVPVYVNGTNVIQAFDFLPTFNIGTLDLTNIEVTNIKAKDGTTVFTLADSTGATTFNPGTANQVMYLNSSKVISGSSNMTFNGTTLTVADITDTSLTANRVIYTGVGGNLLSSANLTFDNSTLTVGVPSVISVNSSSDALRITQIGSGNALLVEDSANPDASPTLIDNSGRLIVGATATRSVASSFQNTITNQVFVEQAGAVGLAPATFVYNSDDSNATRVVIGKSRGTAVGAVTTLQNNDGVGTLLFAGADGTTINPVAASISVSVDGTPGTNDMPGRLVFSTTADGASSPTERMRITNAGNVGIGGTPAAGRSLAVSKNITGDVSGFGIRSDGTIQSDVTSAAYYFRSVASTQATTFTCSQIQHYSAGQGTIGAGSTLTNQYGYFAESSLTGATNNFGFYSNIAAGSNRWNFYANGTASNFFGGNTIISVADNTNAALRITQTGTGNALVVEDEANPDATPFVVNADGSVGIGVTTPSALLDIGADGVVNQLITRYSTDTNPSRLFLRKARGTRSSPASVASGDIVNELTFSAYDGSAFLPTARIDSVVDGTPGTNDMPGRLVFSTTADGSSTPTERMRINNAGSVSIGGGSSVDRTLGLSKNITGATTAYGVVINGQIQSDVTSAVQVYRSGPSTAAASFTLSSLSHYYATTTALGAGSAVTNQYGYFAESSLTGATNNYGFYGNIAAGTGRWNFYAEGTANNYFAGSVGVGTLPSYRLHVSAISGSVGARIFSNNTGLDITNNDATGITDLATSPMGAGAKAMTFTTYNGTSSAERMRIDSSGNVGIGTSSPASFSNQRSLTIDATSISRLDLRVGGSDTGYLYAFSGEYRIGSVSTKPITFYTNDTEKMRLDSSGNLGLGVTPSAWARKAIQIGDAAEGYVGSNTRTGVFCNYYYDGAGKYIGTGYATLYESSSVNGAHAWFNAPSGTAGNAITFTQAMTLDASGNLGIGTTSPATKVEVAGTSSTTHIRVSATTAQTGFALHNSGGVFGIYTDNSAASGFGKGAYSRNLYSDGNYPVVFWTNDAERMRISSSGNLLVGNTNGDARLYVLADGSAVDPMCVANSNSGSSSQFAIVFRRNTSTVVGSIQTTNVATSYNTSSDYRLKENIAPMTGALAKVAALKPVTYDWKAGGSSEGFIAHELAEVCPDAVSGEKDAVNEDGTIKPQGIDTSFLVATLTAALQEAHGLIKDLQARVEALESK